MPIYVSIRGVAGSTNIAAAPEIWSYGTWWKAVDGSSAPPSQAALETAAQAVYTSAKTFIGTTAMRFQTNVGVTEARVYDYGAQPTPPVTAVGYSLPDAGQFGTTTPTMPLQASLCVSWLTTGRTKPRFGRIYLPPQALTPGVDAYVPTTQISPMLSPIRAHMAEIDTALGTLMGEDMQLVVQSKTAPGYNSKPVTDMRVGRVIDTQRRRRNALPESWVDSAYP